MAIAVLAGACARTTSDSGGRTPRSQTYSPLAVAPGEAVRKGGGVYKVGIPYQIKGQWYQPNEDRHYDRAGIASWYGADFHGRKTANGEVYDMDALTAAHPTLPMPSYAYVTNLANRRTILVRINDRGPYALNRIIDLSRRSASLLGFSGNGTTQVRVRYAGPAPLDGNDRAERRFLAAQPWLRTTHASWQAQTPDPPRAVVLRTVAWSTVTTASLPIWPATAGTGQTVDAGVYRRRENADLLRLRLEPLGPVSLVPVTSGAVIAWRVTLGPFPSEAAAARALSESIAAGAHGARLVRE